MFYQLMVPGPIADVTEVRVLQWHAVPGQALAAGELIVELETYKAVVEVRAERPGVLRELLCAEGEWQKIGASVALLSDTADEPMADNIAELMAMAVSFEVS